MTSTADPIGFFGQLNAGVLLAVTPEYREIKALRRPGAGRAEVRETHYAMQPQYRDIGGVKVRYAEGGKQDGPVVLLLCPLPQSILCYEPIWTTLGTQCRLVALDLPGFGRSEGGLEFMSFEAQSRFLKTFVETLGLQQVHLIGPDVGMAAALHYVIHQEHEAASLLIGDGPGILPTANGSIINKAVDSGFWRMMFQITGAKAFVEGAYRLACVNYVPSADEVADYVASYDGRIGPITYWFKTYPENLATVDPHLAALDLPVQLFWGDLDQFLLVDNAHRLHERLPRSQLRVFERCGHFSYQDKPEEFAQMVLDWVGGGYRGV
jgi:pimeloyl-ACP methyl ester carboxylesterase